MIKVFTVAEMVAAERAADAAGTTYDQMMETAGKAVADALMARHAVRGRTITILVGPGNNGGDGLVTGRYLAEAGAEVAFYLFKERDPEKDVNLARVQEMGLSVLTAAFDQRYRVLRTRLNITDIVIDALLGTGVSRPITGDLARLMKQVQAGLEERAANRSASFGLVSAAQLPSLPAPAAEEAPAENDFGPDVTAGTGAEPRRPIVIAVDCPSGLNCDTGALDPLAVPADVTVTFAGAKRGHFRFPGAAACGELVVADIGISPRLPEVESVSVELLTAATAGEWLPARPADGHKGTFGWILIAAGSARYWGAPALAARGAYRSGAGLVALAVPSSIRASLATQIPEATYPLISDEHTLSAGSAELLLDDLGTYQAILLGPGLHEAADFVQALLANRGRSALPPTVIDADGLNLVAAEVEWPQSLPKKTILTPHPGEMARLMGIPVGELKAMDRVDVARKKAADWGCTILLKGAYTVVAAADGRCVILPFANPALATAGSGDVLSGIIVALLGQGLAPFEAAALGGYLHAAAAEVAGVEAGLLAGEIADHIPAVWTRLAAGL